MAKNVDKARSSLALWIDGKRSIAAMNFIKDASFQKQNIETTTESGSKGERIPNATFHSAILSLELPQPSKRPHTTIAAIENEHRPPHNTCEEDLKECQERQDERLSATVFVERPF